MCQERVLCYNKQIFRLSITHKHSLIGCVATGALVLLIVAGIAGGRHATFAADGVCGDGDRDPGETCDDGNTADDDGCSSVCQTERCGNAISDPGEQCDDGNTTNDDGCDSLCRIEFCGDTVVQAGRGETCDDGNRIDNDGCSAACLLEGENRRRFQFSSSSSDGSQTPDAVLSVSAEPESAAPSVPSDLVQAAKDAAASMASALADPLLRILSLSDQQFVQAVLTELANGIPLSPDERTRASNIASTLEQSSQQLKQTTLDSVQSFVDSAWQRTSLPADLSSAFTEGNLPEARAILVRTLEGTDGAALVSSIDAGLRSIVGADALDSSALDQFGTAVSDHTSPADALATLAALRSSVAAIATPDPEASIRTIASAAAMSQGTLGVLSRDLGVPTDLIEFLLRQVHDLAAAPQPNHAELIAAVDRLTAVLQTSPAFGSADLAALTMERQHAAAQASAIAQRLGVPQQAQPHDLDSLISMLAEAAPDEFRAAFESGTPDEQIAALRRILASDTRLADVLGRLPDTDRAAFEAQIEAILSDTQRTMADRLSAILELLDSVQQTIRNRSWLSRLVGSLQDTFDIR